MARKTSTLSICESLTRSEASRETVHLVGLCYTRDTDRGYRRVRRGLGFVYTNGSKRAERDRRQLTRFDALRIPPAWTDVWICSDENGHLQATGRDARGRKQYRYHDRWRLTRDELKYERMIAFGRALPRIRRRIARDLRRPRLDRDKVLAAVGRLLDQAHLRVGGEAYERENRSFGLATIKSRHAAVRGDEIQIRFRGKSGKLRLVKLNDRRLAAIVRRCQELPGQDLFQYQADDGTVCDVKSQDVNAYLREASGGDFTAKDFRTWAATVMTIAFLRRAPQVNSQTARKRIVVAALAFVSERLGNTPAVCRKSYVHPGVLGLYLAGELPGRLRVQRAAGLTVDEQVGLAILRRLSGQTAHSGNGRAGP